MDISESILRLEEELNTTLTKGNPAKTVGRNSYCVDENNEVIILNLSKNHLEVLPDLSAFPRLLELDLSFNKLTNCLPLRILKRLVKLNIKNNINIVNIDFLENCDKITYLHLGSNSISDISPIQKLRNLETLILNNNKIRSIESLKELMFLTELDLSFNEINIIPSFINFKRLTTLSLTKNGIEDVSFLEGLTSLRNLSLSSNQIKDIFPLINLKNLKTLDLDYNQIGIVPIELSNFFIDSRKNLINPLVRPPKLIFEQGREQVLKYYKDMESQDWTGIEIEGPIDEPEEIFGRIKGKKTVKSPKIPNEPKKEYTAPKTTESLGKPIETKKPAKTLPINEAKLIFIGNGRVGKSSIRTKLMNREDKLPELSTHGMDVFEWDTIIQKENNPIKFKFNIWDFGGQGEYRTVQQFFCARNSIYVYVTSHDDQTINHNDEYIDFDFWYPFVMIYRNDTDKEKYSPLIHVRNKTDVGVLPLNESSYRKLYPNMYPEFIQVSCKDNSNMDVLEELIKKVLTQLGSDIFSEYPVSWMMAKAEFEKMRNHEVPFITRDYFDEICKKNGMDDEAIEIWIRILDSIGTITYFGKIDRLKHLVILNPEWLKEAAYRVLKKNHIRNNYGVFKDFDEIWKGAKYPKDRFKDLTELMRAFEICYIGKDERNNTAYFIPSLFAKKSEDQQDVFDKLVSEHSKDEECYLFKITYDLYMPAGILHKLMIRHSNEIDSRHKWSDSVIFNYKGTYAEVSENWKKKRILIKIQGKNPGYIYRFVTNGLKVIGEELVESKSIRPLKFRTTAFYKGSYEKITSLEKNPLAVKHFNFLFETNRKKRIFISYSKDDLDWVLSFTRSLKTLLQDNLISVWFCTDMIPGDEVDKKIKEESEGADIICFMCSDKFYDTPYIIENELRPALKRKEEGGKQILLPIIVDHCRWITDDPEINLGKYNALPYRAKPVSDFGNISYAWKQINWFLEQVVKNNFNGDMLDFDLNMPAELKKILQRQIKGELDKKTNLTTYLALFRGVKTPDNKSIKMGDLKHSMEAAGFVNVRTYIQSGNVFIDSGEPNQNIVSDIISKTVMESFGLDVPILIATKEDIKACLENNHFLREEDADLKNLYVSFISNKVSSQTAAKLDLSFIEPDKIQFDGRRIYLKYLTSKAESKLNNNWIEENLNVISTMRNWDTIEKLYQMFQEK
ncbi:DUF1697 domain-containing protein [Flavobacterium wongokense]|uniref:DUF1697 domain-containing protein n=1 Tax=Flavobacterium wongokense TaxID=2910674 RepID=UPI001F2ECB69|nr:COR domain-containing protein [Flavobacterium sp. WG47]MCF6132003.1 DUF1697 domain-containing protein [Flavobacterium sp. WG47]